MPSEAVSELELDAYLDGELDLARRLAVEDHLAHRPEAAARFMADLRTRTSLRLLAGGRPAPSPALTDAAARLTKRLGAVPSGSRRRRLFARTAAGAGLAAALAFLGVFAGWRSVPAPPDYVTDAVMSYQTGLLRAAMTSQIESPRFDQSEIRRSTSIRVPDLPEGWRITDVQIFPSDEGPALQIMVRTAAGEPVSIFAVKARSEAPRSPVTIRHGTASVAYWSNLGMSYALTGAEEPTVLDLAAEDLADNVTS